jgi:enoyl-CoA hydratase/carnithine racemase
VSQDPHCSVWWEDRGGFRRVVLNRPDKLNAFNATQFTAVTGALVDVADDKRIKCVVLSATGRAFSAGSDLADDVPDEGAGARFIEALAAFPKPVIAGVNGLAVGIGVTLLGLCDLVIAAESARFRLPFVALGLCPEAGSSVSLRESMGPQSAAYALYTGSWLDAAEAARQGLVWRVVADADLASAATAVAQEIAAMPIDALVTTKRLLAEQRLPRLRAAIQAEASEFERLRAGSEHRDAVAAFLDRRTPATSR